MIELLGIGVPNEVGGWLLHRVSARWERGQLIAVVSALPAERLALVDTVAGVRVPEEGRAWLGGVPLSRETMAQIQARAADVDLHLELVDRRSVLWNTLAGQRPGLRTLAGLVRFPQPRERESALRALSSVGLAAIAHEPAARLDREERACLAMARALRRRPPHLVIREIDVVLGIPDAERLLTVARAVVRADGITAVVSVGSLSLARRFADRVVVIADGLLVLDTPPNTFTEDQIAWRLRPEMRPATVR